MAKSCGAPQPGVDRFSYPLYLVPSAYEAGFVSAAHGAAEIEATLAAAREAFKA